MPSLCSLHFDRDTDVTTIDVSFLWHLATSQSLQSLSHLCIDDHCFPQFSRLLHLLRDIPVDVLVSQAQRTRPRPRTIVVRPSGPVCTGLRAIDYTCDHLYMVILVLSNNSVCRRPIFFFGLSYCSFVHLRLTLSPTCSIVLVASHPGVGTPVALRLCCMLMHCT